MNFTPAAEATGAVVAAITDDQLGLPTPSPDHTVGTLLAHVDALSVGLAYTARKAAAPPDPGTLRPGWRSRIPAQLLELARRWEDPAAWTGRTAAGGVPLDAADAGMFALDEIVVHGWELARATGRPYATDEAAVRACADFLDGAARSSALFGPVVEVPPDAPAIDRLIGLTGRDPNWRR